MLEPAIFSRLLGKLSDTLLAPASLPEFMADLVAVGGCRRGGVLAERPCGNMRIVAPVGFDPDGVEAYNRHFHQHDLLLRQPAQEGPLAFTRRNEDAHWPAYSRSAFFHEWAVPNEVRHVAFATAPGAAGRKTLLLGLPRDNASTRPLQVLRLLAPHFRRTMAVAERMQHLQRRGEALLAALDRWSYGAVLLDAGGRLLHANAAAEAMARRDDGLRLGAQGVRATHRPADRALSAMLAAAAGGAPPGTAEAGAAVVVVPRPSLAPAYVVHAFPLAARSPGPWTEGGVEEAAVLLVIVDPARAAPTREALARAVFGLTAAEAAVALRMAAGKGLPAVAEEMGVSHATARSHLQRAFEKTGAHRQSELAVLLARLSPDLLPPAVSPAPAPRPGRPGPGSRSG